MLSNLGTVLGEQLKVNPRDAAALAELADARAMLGQGPQARALVARALAIAPGDADVLQVAAGIDEMLGRRDAALARLAQALAAGYSRWEIALSPRPARSAWRDREGRAAPGWRWRGRRSKGRAGAP
jgi:tetratricopeptide (TPR) repeat protein